MATVRAKVPAESADTSGISVVTSTRAVAAPRRGAIYDPTLLAAATPVHLHPLSPGRFLMLFSKRWFGAEMSETDPAAMVSYLADFNPGWAIVDGAGSQAAPGGTYGIPGLIGTTLVAAASLGNTYLFTLSTPGTGGFINHFRYSPERDMMLPVAEEVLPGAIPLDGPEVQFNRGLYHDGSSLVVVGADATGALYLARKSWGRIGVNTTVAKGGRAVAESIEDSSWEYFTGQGWSRSPAELGALPLSSVGPVSVATFRQRRYIATVYADDEERLVQVYSKRAGVGEWTPDGAPVPLGAADTGTYLGGTLQFQQQIPTTQYGIPYTISVLQFVGEDDDERVSVHWDAWPVVG
jgi:hypothetical protein